VTDQRAWVTGNGCHIHRVLGGRSNSYLVSNGLGEFLLVDTGRKDKWASLVERMEDLGVTPAGLAGLVLTHVHFDHTENAAAIKQLYKVPIILHGTEEGFLKYGDNAPIAGTIFPTKIAIRLLAGWFSRHARYAPATVDYRAEECRDLTSLGFNAAILSTPGHTAGSISVVVDNEVALVGDAMFGVLRGSILPPFGVDLNQIVRSWGRLLDTGCSVFLPGHGAPRDRDLVQRVYERYKKKYL
jgi:hydroxyacylglutathione hydrolase